MAERLRMGTRASALARTQSGHVAAALAAATGVAVDEVLVRTEGDQLSTEGRIPSAGDSVGVFVRALDDALRRHEVDFAVHSLKDVPTVEAEGLVLAAVPVRADVRDALVVASRHRAVGRVTDLPSSAHVATASPRRVAQLLRLRPDLRTVTMAGNVDTRLKRLEEGRADALILACAGLDRLSLGGRISVRIPEDDLLPAPAQGALAIVCRADDAAALKACAALDDRDARATATAERSLLAALRAGCRAPVAAHAVADGETLRLRARVLSLDGSEMLEADAEGPRADAEGLGKKLADDLLARGAERLVSLARST